MMSPRPNSDDRGSSNFRHTPLQILHIIASFLRIWSIYSMYRYLSQTGVSVIIFIFCCLVPSSILFLLLQKPWKGRPLLNTQMVPSVINGGITALYFILWGKGLKSCGPVRALLAEYSGAVLGVLSAVLYGRRGHVWKKVGGLIAMLASFYFLSQGWATETSSPFSFKDSLDAELRTEQVLGMKEMVVPLLAGILSALRRVIARRVSLKNTLKRRLHAITITSATCFLFPVAMLDLIIGSKSSSSVDLPFSAWAFLSTTLFGIILIFYVDAMAEERHLMVAGGCIIVMEMVYKMDFSLIGFIICSLILGFGIYEATSLDHGRKDTFQKPDLSNGMLGMNFRCLHFLLRSKEYQRRILFLFAAFLAKINFVAKIIGSLTLLARDLTVKFFVGDVIGISEVNVKMIGNFRTNCRWSEPLMWPNRRLVRK